LLPILRSGTGPGSSADGAPSFAEPEFAGVHDGVLTIGDIVAKAEGCNLAPGRLDWAPVAREAEAAGFLLPEDAAIIVNSAAESPIFGQVAPSGPPR